MSSARHARFDQLRSRRVRRVLVVAAVVITAPLGSLLPDSLHGFGILVVLVLAGLDALLIQATAGLAFARRHALDERERALRDLAYRRGFRLLGLAAVLEVVALIVTGILSVILAPDGQRGLGTTAVNNGITGRGLVVLAELLLMTPTLVIAWVDPNRERDETGTERRGQRVAWLALPALGVAWLVLVMLAPQQVVTASTNSSSASVQGATCMHFAAGRMVDAEFGATVGLRVEVCWNGHNAFVFGDPRIPLPRSAVAGLEAGMPADLVIDPSMFNTDNPDLSGCGRDNSDDFATVSTTTCTGVIDDSGTLHYSVHAIVSGPLGLGQRDVTLTLVVDRTGNVLQRP
jgi:hypothetical protein